MLSFMKLSEKWRKETSLKFQEEQITNLIEGINGILCHNYQRVSLREAWYPIFA